VIIGVVAVWRVPTSRWLLHRRWCGRGGRRWTRRGCPAAGGAELPEFAAARW